MMNLTPGLRRITFGSNTELIRLIKCQLHMRISRTLKSIYIFEFIVSFVPILSIWALGVFFLPASIEGAISGNVEHWVAIVLVFSGALGFWGAVNLLLVAVSSSKFYAAPKRLLVYLIIGMVSCILFISYIDSYYWHTLLFLLPVLATLHLIYVKKSLFFSKV